MIQHVDRRTLDADQPWKIDERWETWLFFPRFFFENSTTNGKWKEAGGRVSISCIDRVLENFLRTSVSRFPREINREIRFIFATFFCPISSTICPILSWIPHLSIYPNFYLCSWFKLSSWSICNDTLNLTVVHIDDCI